MSPDSRGASVRCTAAAKEDEEVQESRTMVNLIFVGSQLTVPPHPPGTGNDGIGAYLVQALQLDARCPPPF